MVSTESLRGRIGLAMCQAAGTLELIAMPLWVGMLMQVHGLDPQRAGAMVSLYVAGAVVGGVLAARAFGRLPTGRGIAAVGAAAGAGVFVGIAVSRGDGSLMLLHLLGGLCIGPVLAVTEGTIARSARPHRLFAICSLAVSLFAAGFLGLMPACLARQGGSLLFLAIAAVLVLGACTAVLAFPVAPPRVPAGPAAAWAAVPRGVWCGIAGLCLMSCTYTMTLAFLERLGMARGYGVALVGAVLTATAVVKLLPAALAGLLEKRLQARRVVQVLPALQAVFAAGIFALPDFAAYAVLAPLFVGTLLFTHVFAFGLLSAGDAGGRVMAAKPSLMLVGAGIGPLLGGTLVKAQGYPALAAAAAVLGLLAMLCFRQLTRLSPGVLNPGSSTLTDPAASDGQQAARGAH